MTETTTAEPLATGSAVAGPGWFVGAYPLFPKGEWDPAAEEDILAAARAVPEFTGFELPFTGGLHAEGDDWLLRRIGPGAQVVLTLVPGVVARSAADPAFGLASTDDDARGRAIDFVRDALTAAARVNAAIGAGSVRAVLLHSAPAASAGSSAHAFSRSIAELAGLDRHGARLLVEHCDAPAGHERTAKGFLPLSEEAAVIADANARDGSDVGLLVNWGRSAIEGQDAATPAAHVALAREAGVLGGVMFSGVSDRPDARSGPWADVHLPPAGASGEHSLLDAAAVEATLAAAGDLGALSVLGMKIGTTATATAAERVAVVRRSNDALLAVVRRMRAASHAHR